MTQIIPAPYPLPFNNGIYHPLLYLWDAWSYAEDSTFHLYCLAVARKKADGTAMDPSERNNFPFHIRHFSSLDEGNTWTDEGCFLEVRSEEDKHDSRTIWSGSIHPLPKGEKLVAYTGLHNMGVERPFLQTIALGLSTDGATMSWRAQEPLSSPLRDWETIRAKGYYLDQVEKLGHRDGEGGGPIMAWRDPYIYLDSAERIHLFWAAKVGSHSNAMAHALLDRRDDSFFIDRLLAPTVLPDGEEFTQLELPKIHFDPKNNWYYLIVSSCNRLYEGQSDAEVDKAIRLYRSKALQGPWEPWGINGSRILGPEHLFGMTVIKEDFEQKRLLCISPYTDAAPDFLGLTFSKPFYVYLDPVKVVFP